MTSPFGQARPRGLEDFWNFLERLQNGVLPFRKVVIAGPLATAVTAVTAAYAARETDATILADATAAAFAVTLPSARAVRGRQYIIKRMNAGANAVTVACAGAETVDGAATVALAAQYDRVHVQSSGTGWVRID